MKRLSIIMAVALPLDAASPATRLAAYGAAFAIALAIHFFMTTGEAALLGFSRVRRRQLVEEGVKGISSVERLLARTQRYLLTHVLVTSLLIVVAAVNATLFGLVFAEATGVSSAMTLFVAGLIAVVLVATFGRVLPRAVGARRAERVSLRVAPFMNTLVNALSPVTGLLQRVTAEAYGHRNGHGPDEREPGELRSEEELKTFITLGAEEGILEEEEEEMIQSVIELGETRVNEIMIPRPDMAAVPAEATPAEIKNFVLETGFSRIPVYQGSLDNTVGVIYVKEVLLRLLESEGDKPVKEFMREPFFVPETMKLDDLLGELQDRRVHLAVVVDEYGSTVGLITLEDVLEEIVGEIFDEYDLRSEPVRILDERTAIVDARMNVSDLNDTLETRIPEDGPYDTLGGFIFHKLGRIGKEGEVLREDSLDLHVEKVVNRRILRVRVVKREPEPEEGGSPPGSLQAESEGTVRGGSGGS